MKHPIAGLQKAFDHRYRLGIMSILMVNDWVDFRGLQDALELSDGNLASHLRALESEKFIEIKKQFIGRKPNTSYRATAAGRAAFQAHLDHLERLLRWQE